MLWVSQVMDKLPGSDGVLLIALSRSTALRNAAGCREVGSGTVHHNMVMQIAAELLVVHETTRSGVQNVLAIAGLQPAVLRDPCRVAAREEFRCGPYIHISRAFAAVGACHMLAPTGVDSSLHTVSIASEAYGCSPTGVVVSDQTCR